MSGWFLQSIAIEGFRGINNEGDPLVLNFKDACITSISAPNGVGKSSIFDAVSFAIRGRIPKLDALPASESGAEYYINRFHHAGVGRIVLTLASDGVGTAAAITVTRQPDGTRTVAGPSNAEALLAELDREFVLLDHDTFQSFISDRDLDRGRSFAGLLNLRQYSELRQELQGLANTRAFNGHCGTAALLQQKRALETQVRTHQRTSQQAFEALTGMTSADHAALADPQAAAHRALDQIPLVKPHCTGKGFHEIDFDACVVTIKEAEGGDDRARLAQFVRDQATIEGLVNDGLSDDHFRRLKDLADQRDATLSAAGSALVHAHLTAAAQVLLQPTWTNKNLCPTCGTENDVSVLNKVQASLAPYEAVQRLADDILTAWQDGHWSALAIMEDAAKTESEASRLGAISRQIGDNSLAGVQAEELWTRRTEYRTRLLQRLDGIRAERQAIEQRLPPSLVELTTRVEQAKRLNESWTSLRGSENELAQVKKSHERVDRVKLFLDKAAEAFAAAEATAAQRRLTAVQPLCRTLFAAIIHDPVEPALVKPVGAEELRLSLARFWSLQDVSAQALLSESFRNAFAVAVYLAAAKLYGGQARFMILDDVTSSFDAGHQFHLMDVIRTKFARPGQVDGPQVILLSHDTLLEKLFNKNANGSDWQHIRLEGTARTAVLPQSNASNRVRDMTVSFLKAGQVEDGALRLRQYLEYKLLEVIGRINIPVPVDFALDDTKKQVQSALDAIQAAVALHQTAGQIVLDQQQQAGLQANVASITGNFLAHYATGSTQAFSASSLLGVVAAIDAYAQCFTYEDPPGSGNRRYYRSLSRR